MKGGSNRNQNDRRQPRVADRSAESEQEEQQEVEEAAPEHQRLQNQLGNQTIQSILTGRGGASGAGGASVEVDGTMHAVEEDQESELEYGGIDDPDDDVPTILDLTRSWNPKIKKEKDRPRFTESMPDPEIPPEDRAFLTRMRRRRGEALPASNCPDVFLQPSTSVMVGSAMAWTRGLRTWIGQTPDSRLVHQLICHPDALQDPWGRVVPMIGRIGAIGTLLLASGPAWSPFTRDGQRAAGFAHFCMELLGRQHKVEEVHDRASELENRLPGAFSLLERELTDWPTTVATEAGSVLVPHLVTPIDALMRLTDPMGLVPELVAAQSEAIDDDPLGIDDLLAQFTGGRPDPAAALYQQAIDAAERLAAKSAYLRVRAAGVAAAIADASEMYSKGPPGQNLGQMLQAVDAGTQRVLQLLVEIAGAARSKNVPLRGIRNGLFRAARLLAQVQEQAAMNGAAIAEALVVARPLGLSPPSNREFDAFDLLIDEGRHRDSVAWARGLHDSGSATLILAQMLAGLHTTAPELCEIRDHQRPESTLSACIGVFAGAALLREEDFSTALSLSDSQMGIATARRNPLLAADSVNLKVEALWGLGDKDGAEVAREKGARLAWQMGCPIAPSLLARWRPPGDLEPEPADLAPSDSDSNSEFSPE